MDDLSFHEFVQSRWPDLVRFAWTLVGDRGHAEDAVQVVLERCWQKWSGIRVVGGAEAYVRASIVNEVLSRRRRLRRRPRETPYPGPAGGDLPGAGMGPAEAGGDPADAGVRSVIVWDELQRLPPRMRAVVVLRFLEDRSEPQTARILGCSIGTVKSQTARAMARLGERAGLQDLVAETTQEEMTR